MFPGYASRLEIELKKLYIENNLKLAKDKTIKIPMKIIDSPRRKFSVFIGAAVLSTTYKTPQELFENNENYRTAMGGSFSVAWDENG